MKATLGIENLKCGGCAATIKKGLLSLDGVKNVAVSVESSEVTYEANEDAAAAVKEKLSKMGYPIVGDKNSLGHKAKSFVSCAIGRMESSSH